MGLALDGGPQVWSSTYVRACLAAGDVEGAAEALGRPFSVPARWSAATSVAASSATRPPTCRPAALADPGRRGVRRLAARARHGADPLPAAISVGTNPTFAGDRERRVEAYVLDRDDLELYGVRVEISFVARIRGMVRFEGSSRSSSRWPTTSPARTPC